MEFGRIDKFPERTRTTKRGRAGGIRTDGESTRAMVSARIYTVAVDRLYAHGVETECRC